MSNPNAKRNEPEEIDAEVIEESPRREKTSAMSRGSTFFHPLSGLAILAVDWLAFGMDLPSGFLLVAVTAILAFVVTFAAVYWIQRKESTDSPSRAGTKALVGAIAAGIPFPITGTILGVGILLLSGLPTSFKFRK